MQLTNHLSPDRMTPEQRRGEVASLLAAALNRLRHSAIYVPKASAQESEVLLGFSGDQSVHVNPPTRE